MREQIVDGLLAFLRRTDEPSDATWAGGVLVSLEPSVEDNERIRAVLIDVLSKLTASRGVGDLVAQLLTLGAVDSERVLIRNALLELLGNSSDQWDLRELVGLLRSVTAFNDWLGWLRSD